jgi:predicted nucleotidyltransferase
MKPAPDHGLSDATVAEIRRVLSAFPQIERAALFGSRAKETHRLGSDIDLALFGPDLDERLLGQIAIAFEDTMLPHRFDLLHRNEHVDWRIGREIVLTGREIYSAPDANARFEARLNELWRRGTIAWADVPSASAWVEEQRDNVSSTPDPL